MHGLPCSMSREKFLRQWGTHGVGPGQLDVPHCLAMDTRGHLYVGDRWNNRIQVFDQQGKLLHILTQFSRPSGIVIDKKRYSVCHGLRVTHAARHLWLSSRLETRHPHRQREGWHRHRFYSRHRSQPGCRIHQRRRRHMGGCQWRHLQRAGRAKSRGALHAALAARASAHRPKRLLFGPAHSQASGSMHLRRRKQNAAMNPAPRRRER